MKQIFFWQESDKYGAFSNFFPSPFLLDGRIWPTVEHYFQAMKTLDPVEQEAIRLAETPLHSKRMGRKVAMRPDWEEVRYGVMMYALLEKFQTPDLKELLLSTEDAEIYEDSPFDKIWGTGERGGVGTGQNLLGKALMETREALRRWTVMANLQALDKND